MPPIVIASSRYSKSSRPMRAPSAFLRPISRTRSLTAMIMVFTTESPPMTSASRAAPVITAEGGAGLLEAGDQDAGLLRLHTGHLGVDASGYPVQLAGARAPGGVGGEAH